VGKHPSTKWQLNITNESGEDYHQPMLTDVVSFSESSTTDVGYCVINFEHQHLRFSCEDPRWQIGLINSWICMHDVTIVWI
jgi:hypothetical protein